MAILTKEEKAWFRKLQKVLDECPTDRISAYTVGDNDLTFYDNTKDDEINEAHNYTESEFGNIVESMGAELIFVRFPCAVHSVSG